MFAKIRSRLTATFIGLAVLPILCLGTFIAVKSYTAAKQEAARITHDTALRVAGEVENFIRGMVDHIEVITWVHGLHRQPHDKQMESLRELLAFQNAYDELALLDPQGNELVRVHRTRMVLSSELGNRAATNEFLVPMQSGAIYFGPVLYREQTGEPYMTCAVPFRDPQTGDIAGIIAGDLRLKKIWELLAGLALRPGEQVYIADDAGFVVAHKNPSIVLRGTRALIDQTDHDNSAPPFRGLGANQPFLADHHIFLGNQRLHVISEWQRRQALALAHRMLLVIALGTLVALAAAVLVMIPVVGTIVRPLQKLATTARRIEAGELPVQAEVTGDDEISELGRAFNEMTGKLHGSMQALRDEVNERSLVQKALQRELLINEALASLSKIMLAADSISAIADEVRKRAQDLTTSSHGYTGYIDPKTGNLICPTITAMLGKQCRVDQQDFRIEFPHQADGSYDHLWGVSLNSRQPFYTNEPAEHPCAHGLPAGHMTLANFLSVPILFNDTLMGQIAVANTPEGYQDKDVDALERLGRLYALALNRIQSQQEKDRLILDLRQSQKMEAIGTLAGGIAHDFNNMLTPILGYSELALARLQPEDPLFPELESIHQAGLRAKDLIKRILAFSRQREHELAAVPVQPILKETIKLLRSSLPTTIAIRENIDPGCGAIHADLTQFQQVVMNLGTNAYHAMGDGGGVLAISLRQITITAHDPLSAQGLPPGPVACLTISDTGCGMDKTTLNRIFEPYFTTKEQGKGTGMGLAMVHGIIRTHHGHISVYSEPGQGTTFKIYLPIVTEAVPDQDTAMGTAAAGNNERILLVDDEAPIITMLQNMLSRLGYQVSPMTDSRQALEHFKARPEAYDLVITDQTMPGLTGGELARAMLAIRPDLPIILCTGFSESFTEELAHEVGIREYIMKPVIIQELTQKIRAVLDKE
jgi:signal transduction histidine kinase/ActR/RegA family two-component response regulator